MRKIRTLLLNRAQKYTKKNVSQIFAKILIPNTAANLGKYIFLFSYSLCPFYILYSLAHSYMIQSTCFI